MGYAQEHTTNRAKANDICTDSCGQPDMPNIKRMHGYIGVIDLSFNEPVCAIGDFDYRVHSLKKVSVVRHAKDDEKLNVITKSLLDTLKESNIDKSKMKIIIISHPGIIGNNNTYQYVNKRHHALTQIGLKQYLQKYFNIPIFLENNAKLAAMGEMHFGMDVEIKDLIYVSCGIGLSSGIISNGKLYNGGKRAAGEIGSFLDCDNRRIEDVVALEGLTSYIEGIFAIAGKSTKLSFSDIVNLARKEDELALKGIYDIGKKMGRVIYNCSIMLDIPTVIVGGDYLQLGHMLFDGIDASISDGLLYRPKVIRSILRESASVYGCFIMGKNKVWG